MSAVALDRATLRALAGMTDEVGILSIYVSIDPHYRVEAASRPPWELRVRRQLDRLPERLKEHGPREHWKALVQRLEQLEPQLVQLMAPTTTGQGRALFAAVAGEEVRTVTLQVPLADRAVLEPDPYLAPLVAAWSAAGPAGAVSVSEPEVRVIDLRFGLTEVVGAIQYRGVIEQRELKGPAATVPGLFRRGAPQHDLFERREDEKLVRHLRTIGPRLAEFAAQREWGVLVLTGDATLVQAVRDGLPPQLPVDVVTLDHPVNSLSPAKLAATVAPAIDEARHRRLRELAERARGDSGSGSPGARGLSETLGALQQGRVDHLLLDADRQWSGRRSTDGFLVPDGEIPPGTEGADLTDEPHLGERMIELAFRDSARVSLLPPEAAEPLADVDGVGALLRW